MPFNPDATCSALSAEQPLLGTASRNLCYVAARLAKPWPAKVEKALPEALVSLKKRLPFGLLATPTGPGPLTIYRWHEGRTWQRPVALEELEQALLGPPEGAPVEPCLYVCTHGSRDLCCGRLGARLVEEARRLGGRPVYECSHLGGHRFAPTLLLLPEWRLAGRVTRLEEVLRGTVPAEFLRGAAYLDPELQVVEPELERRLGPVLPRWEGELIEAGGHRFRAAFQRTSGQGIQSCADVAENKLGDYEVLRLESLEEVGEGGA